MRTTAERDGRIAVGVVGNLSDGRCRQVRASARVLGLSPQYVSQIARSAWLRWAGAWDKGGPAWPQWCEGDPRRSSMRVTFPLNARRVTYESELIVSYGREWAWHTPKFFNSWWRDRVGDRHRRLWTLP